MAPADHTHGTRSGGYKRCRHKACRTLRAQIRREVRDTHRAERIFDTAQQVWIHPKLSSQPPGTGEGPWHGTATGYTSWCCRCLTVPSSDPPRPGCGPVGRDAATDRRRTRHHPTPPEGSTR